jgi:hypothetical protein
MNEGTLGAWSRKFHHPLDGTLLYEQITLIPATHPGYKLVLLLPTG